MDKLKIGISACLTGANVRYDGISRESAFFRSLERDKLIEWVPVCPETEAGMGVPRKSMQLVSQGENTSRLCLVTIETAQDMTEILMRWCGTALKELRSESICGFIFKSRSPSCGISGVDAISRTGALTPAMGLFASAFINEFPLLPAGDDERIGLHGEGEEFFRRALLCHNQDVTKTYAEALMRAVRQSQPNK